jgi:hypothetical protein
VGPRRLACGRWSVARPGAWRPGRRHHQRFSGRPSGGGRPTDDGSVHDRLARVRDVGALFRWGQRTRRRLRGGTAVPRVCPSGRLRVFSLRSTFVGHYGHMMTMVRGRTAYSRSGEEFSPVRPSQAALSLGCLNGVTPRRKDQNGVSSP